VLKIWKCSRIVFIDLRILDLVGRKFPIDITVFVLLCCLKASALTDKEDIPSIHAPVAHCTALFNPTLDFEWLAYCGGLASPANPSDMHLTATAPHNEITFPQLCWNISLMGLVFRNSSQLVAALKRQHFLRLETAF
jgi:hypothetical protein